MQAHIDRLEEVDGILKNAGKTIGPGFARGRVRDARRVLRLTIDDLSLEDGNGDAKAGPTMDTKEKLANHEARLDLNSGAHDSLLLIIRNQSKDIRDLRQRVKRLEAQRDGVERYWLAVSEGSIEAPGLAESLITGIKPDAELLRREREAGARYFSLMRQRDNLARKEGSK